MTDAKTNREKIIAEAMENARIARNAIGQERLDQMRNLINKTQPKMPGVAPSPQQSAPPAELQAKRLSSSPSEQAKKILQAMDSQRLQTTLAALHKQKDN